MSPSRSLFDRNYTEAGASPGTFDVPPGAHPSSMHAFTFDAERVQEHQPRDVAEAAALVAAGHLTWIDVRGLQDATLLRQLGRQFGLHPLALADVVNVGQRPKADTYGDTLFCVVRMCTLEAGGEFRWEQVSLFVDARFVITFQERPGDCFDPLRERLRLGRQQLRTAGAGYLACMMIDAVVDAYFPLLEEYGEQLESLEERVIDRATQEVLADVYGAKRELIAFRRAVWPLRDTLNQMLRDGHVLLRPDVLPYLRDTADHVMQVVDVVENFRELAASFVEVYLSSVSNRTNDVMRVLTLIATIFIPLTFLAGVYGMNFDTRHPLNMPELGWRHGYVAFWSVSLLLLVTMLVVFGRLGWLRFGSRRRPGPPDRAPPPGP